MTNNISPSEIDYAHYWNSPLPKESSKMYARYLTYRNMSPIDRSIRRVAEIEGTEEKNCEIASAKFKWVLRSKAYDVRLSNAELITREAGNEAYNAQSMEHEDSELIILTEILQTKMRQTLRGLQNPEMVNGEEVLPDTMEIQRLVASAEKVQNLRRRRGGLGTSYRTVQVDEPDYENETYLVGGGDG